MNVDRAPAAPVEVDTDRPSPARVYDWCLGGGSHFDIDREFGMRMEAAFPLMKPAARSNRAWLRRLVFAALDAGHRQFLDLGSGLPGEGAVHELVAQRLGAGGGRVVYVDYEPVAVAHGRRLLDREQADGWVGIVQADFRDPAAIFADPVTRRVLDAEAPLCVIMASVMQFVGPGDDPDHLIAEVRAPLVPGSWLALSHPTVEGADSAQATAVRAMFDAYAHAGSPAWLRDHAAVTAWFAGLDLIEPGIVHNTDWRAALEPDPNSDDVRPFYWVGVGVVPPTRP